MRIDAHQHFWSYSEHRQDYVWMTEAQSLLKRDFGPEQLQPLLEENGFAGCVAVQAREKVGETNYLLDLADRHGFILGVVGWLDLLMNGSRHSSNAISRGPC